MKRCHLKGAEGDAIHAVLCAAGYNIRWLLRMIRKKGIRLYLAQIKLLGLGRLLAKIRQQTESNASNAVTKLRHWRKNEFFWDD